jgi:Flp pilus assembly protein TadB
MSPLGRRRPDGRPIPAHPYRDTALLYAAMALVIVVVAAATGGDVLRALLAALAFFVLATGWSWWRFRARIREQEAARVAVEAAPESGGNANGKARGGAT